MVACNGPSTSVDDEPAPARFGRADVERASRPTRIALELTGLDAWNEGDSLQLVSPGTGTTLAGLEQSIAIAPSRGSTTLTGQQLDWTGLHAPLIDAARGDVTYVTQLVQHDGYASVGRAGIARGFTVADGAPATLTAQLAPVAQDRRLELVYRGSAFAALAAEAGPGARPAAMASIAIAALPEPLAHANPFAATLYQGLPQLAVVGAHLASADAPLALGYGDPFDRWTEFATVVYPMSVGVITADGATSLPARIVTATPVDRLAAADGIRPVLSPVRDVEVNGLSLAVDQAGLGAAPTVRWQPPALGRATDYIVEVREVVSRPLGIELPVVATLHTRSPSLQLPPVATAGKTYVLTITATTAPGTLPYASADHVTAKLSL
ncbi:MAG TPA: hypothetical protein VGC42_09995 [Kofleriaceae bacterium]